MKDKLLARLNVDLCSVRLSLTFYDEQNRP